MKVFFRYANHEGNHVGQLDLSSRVDDLNTVAKELTQHISNLENQVIWFAMLSSANPSIEQGQYFCEPEEAKDFSPPTIEQISFSLDEKEWHHIPLMKHP
ncbi:hypothetical protein [Chromobacterium violaceum]|uniref:Uncharacterized protein n=1 Tax=Chromobacterium violaceum TaxID=536 RepID=A0AAX2MF56_CHRVL|nr:hypothetical protein [Chromobacterium violaceum]STB70161.1 Uncharacterised protein [Chromobacterium violaceum]SUX34805.1 Uncharacterised protein [Chromobacterium violaceum]